MWITMLSICFWEGPENEINCPIPHINIFIAAITPSFLKALRIK